MHFLHVQETNWIDRNVIQTHHLLERMVARGHTGEIIDYDILWPLRSPRKTWRPRQVFAGTNRAVQGARIPVRRPAALNLPLFCHAAWAAGSLVEAARSKAKRRPDVILSCSLTNSLLLAWLARAWKIPFVYMVMEPYHTMVPQKALRPAAKAVEQMAIRSAGRVFVFTPQMKQYVQAMGAAEAAVRLFHSGVGEDIFLAGEHRAKARAELGIGADEWVLFFMGWLYDFSGMREIVRAVAESPGLLEGARLLIVGDGDVYAELQDIVERCGLASKVMLAGKRPYIEIPALLGAADVCLMPSLENSTTRDIVPMKVYEYLASGRPLVASRLPGMLAEFGDQAGILYTGTPLEALAAARELAGRPEEARRRGERGQQFAREHASWERSADAFEQALLETIHE